MAMPNSSMSIQQDPPRYGDDIHKNFDDDGHEKRTGTMWTASAHIITAVIGSGVLSLAWAIAQLGWVAGPAVLLAFAFVTYFTATILADCYRAPGGQRNHTYMEVVQSYLGGRSVQLCGLAQYSNLVGVTIGYTITASISMVAVNRSNCFHSHGHQDLCQRTNYPYMITFGIIQLVLSQIPNFHELSWLSIVAAVMSFAYSGIGLGLSLAKVIEGSSPKPRTTLTGTVVGVDVRTHLESHSDKMVSPESAQISQSATENLAATLQNSSVKMDLDNIAVMAQGSSAELGTHLGITQYEEGQLKPAGVVQMSSTLAGTEVAANRQQRPVQVLEQERSESDEKDFQQLGGAGGTEMTAQGSYSVTGSSPSSSARELSSAASVGVQPGVHGQLVSQLELADHGSLGSDLGP